MKTRLSGRTASYSRRDFTLVKVATLTTIKKAQQEVLLGQCDFLQFNAHQRNPSNNFKCCPTAAADQVKLPDVSWRCSRQILGQMFSTERVQPSKFVIRN